ncbi:MAG: glycosyltransferase family 39 protein [Actinobacteria bacterium]|nr:glycosyltransferase family 39 protein [Actinomycetota bacterium]
MYKNKINITYIILIVIFTLGLILRVCNLNNFPVGFHIDEASLGYNSYSLLLTGKDDNNNSHPLYIDMFGDFRPSGYHYLTILPVMLFGLTEFATRLPGAIFGSLTVIVFFFFVQILFRDKKISLLSAFFIAVSPWHFGLSRASNEAIVALFFVLAGFCLVFYSLQKQSLKYAILGSTIVSFSFFFYHAPRVFVPLMFLILIIIMLPVLNTSINRYKVGLFFSFIAISFLSLLLVFSISGGTGRFTQVNVFNSFETQFFQKQQIQEDAIANSPYLFSRFFHNKFTNVVLVFISNYLDYFNFNFLFTKGGLPIWYSIPRVGLIYIIELPFIAIGLYYLVKTKDIYRKIPIIWLLTAPVVAAITMDDIPNINRALGMFPMLEIIAAFGFLSFMGILKFHKKIIFIFFVLIFSLNILYFLNQYYFNAKTHKPWYRNNGFSSMMQEVNSLYNLSDKIVMSKYQGGIYPLVLFYMKYDPKTYQIEGSPKNKDYGGFGKFFFVPQDCPSEQTNDKTPKVNKIIYVDKGDCPSSKYMSLKKIKFIYREDGTKAFRIVYE